jgi:hypothetical protein
VREENAVRKAVHVHTKHARMHAYTHTNKEKYKHTHTNKETCKHTLLTYRDRKTKRQTNIQAEKHSCMKT